MAIMLVAKQKAPTVKESGTSFSGAILCMLPRMVECHSGLREPTACDFLVCTERRDDYSRVRHVNSGRSLAPAKAEIHVCADKRIHFECRQSKVTVSLGVPTFCFMELHRMT
ncbi:hypothetical protein BaRGS_00031732 [Batillaria attramentaria]|uniref:Uncharacterized protein n=1 Tax=Batillaria attramentaria TaxID=370345 RepID=A0ABD0JQA1_9CAEN